MSLETDGYQLIKQKKYIEAWHYFSNEIHTYEGMTQLVEIHHKCFWDDRIPDDLLQEVKSKLHARLQDNSNNTEDNRTELGIINNNLGLAYDEFNTKYADEDYNKAIEYYLTAIELGNQDAIVHLAELYSHAFPDNRESSEKKALKYYEIAAKLGDSRALYGLGELYTDSQTLANTRLAIEYHKKAVELGNKDSMDSLGTICSIKCNYDLSIYYYQLALKHGHTDAAFSLAEIYEICDSKKNIKLAIKYFEMAGEAGDKYAIQRLGDVYSNDENNIADIDKAIKYYERAAELDCFRSIVKLCDIYSTHRTKKDFDLVVKYHVMLIDKHKYDVTKYAYNLARLYHEPSTFDTSRKDLDQAIKYYLLAIGHGCKSSASWLAVIYNKETTKKDPELSIKYHLMHIEAMKDRISMNNLAHIYHHEASHKNLDQAIKYYLMAIELKEPVAMDNLACLYHHQTPKKDLDLAIKYYLMSIESGNYAAATRLANLYRSESSKKDLELAIKYYKMAIEHDNNNENAIIGLAEIYYDSSYKADWEQASYYFEMYYKKAKTGNRADVIPRLAIINNSYKTTCYQKYIDMRMRLIQYCNELNISPVQFLTMNKDELNMFNYIIEQQNIIKIQADNINTLQEQVDEYDYHPCCGRVFLEAQDHFNELASTFNKDTKDKACDNWMEEVD